MNIRLHKDFSKHMKEVFGRILAFMMIVREKAFNKTTTELIKEETTRNRVESLERQAENAERVVDEIRRGARIGRAMPAGDMQNEAYQSKQLAESKARSY